ncbi:MAG: 4-alpha-glucanotransferase [Proteobacteria bacterium]|nr:4-alpha-glucanotransferase [Pseudomonadota bacterium]
MKRTSGVLLHFTSLSTNYGIGDLGPEAHRFAEFLAKSRQRHWQVLPVGPTSTFIGNSPYSSSSAFGGNILLISPEALHHQGLLTAAELKKAALPTGPQVDFAAVTRAKLRMLRQIFDRHKEHLLEDERFTTFLKVNAMWISDLAFFMAVKEKLGGLPWFEWPAPLKNREDNALAKTGAELAEPILFHKFCQYLFFSQLSELRARMKELGVTLIGDAPIYVTHDSPDVWCNRRLFKLDPKGLPVGVAGVPPDYFSKTGQRWGNPVFDWRANKDEGFGWWISRLRHNFGLFDQVRLDHFRAFAAYWEVPATEATAMHGRWVRTPGHELLQAVLDAHGTLPIIAEDLGIITQDVVDLRKHFGLPGMRVLQFAFSANLAADTNAPHHHEKDSVVYVGTHDNNTTLGWLAQELDNESKIRVGRYIGRTPDPTNLPWAMIELAMKSTASQAIVTAQDILGLGAEARINTPGERDNNWTWRLTPEQTDTLETTVADKLADLVIFYGREETMVLYDELPEPPADY